MKKQKPFKLRIQKFQVQWLALLFLVGCETTVIYPPDPISYDDGDSVVLNVRPINNDYACTVTALGMWLQFYDDMRYLLMDGMQDIVSDQHMEYYAMPKDTEGNLLPDSSILENPPQNCLADFMKTSWYSEGNFHGATDHWDIVPGIEEYLKFKGDRYQLEANNLGYCPDAFYETTKLIDQGHPVYILVKVFNEETYFYHSLLIVGYVRSDDSYLAYNSFSKLRKHKWDISGGNWSIAIGTDLQIKRKYSL